jgi:hypothetical protein
MPKPTKPTRNARAARETAGPREGNRTKPASAAPRPRRDTLADHTQLKDGKRGHVTYG